MEVEVLMDSCDLRRNMKAKHQDSILVLGLKGARTWYKADSMDLQMEPCCCFS